MSLYALLKPMLRLKSVTPHNLDTENFPEGELFKQG